MFSSLVPMHHLIPYGQEKNSLRENTMKKDRTTLILSLIFLVGLSVMLYPFFSNYWNSKRQTEAVASYDTAVSRMSEKDYDKYFADAESYNQELAQLADPLENYKKLSGFNNILNITESGVIGYITIDKIDTELPIYYGTAEGTLQIGVGLLNGTSFPIGGKGTHAVLSAHRGLPSAELFSRLDEMEEGDTFQITVLNRVLTYEVDQIHIVIPEDVKDLAIDPDKDYCTLMTCTPYGINTHRLLVRGVRIEGLGESVPADAYQVEPKEVAVVITLLILVILMLVNFLIWKARSMKKQKDKI